MAETVNCKSTSSEKGATEKSGKWRSVDGKLEKYRE